MTYTFASATILLILITDPIGNIPSQRVRQELVEAGVL